MRKNLKNVNSISDLLKYLRKDTADYQGQIWFRGQSDFSWKLQPTFLRKNKNISEFTLITRFKQNASLLIDRTPLNYYDWLFQMQHHGVPTRLLDWNRSALTALYFAVDSDKNKDGSLWILLPTELNKNANIYSDENFYIPSFDDDVLKNYNPITFNQEKNTKLLPVAAIASRNNSRMQAQLGVFTISHRDITSIENIGDKKHIWRYKIPKSKKNTIKGELALLGITKFQLFPELSSIGEIIQKWILMAFIEANPLNQTAILKIYSEKDEIIVNPEYQRNGDIWGLEKRQLLIDSILNEYDIPKIYFHKLSKSEKAKTGKDYAIIDGRQRLETIWKFIDGEFSLAEDFEYLKDHKVKAGGMTYSDLGKTYPKLKIKLDSISLPIISISTDDLELIEDMFSRLNEAVPLNAAEKRNALGGAMAKLITIISQHRFFKENIGFSNKRYQHKEAAAKILFLIYSLSKGKRKIVDTKKIYLDDFVKSHRDKADKETAPLGKEASLILNEMARIFTSKDPLLKAQGTFPVYFLLIRDLYQEDKLKKFTRNLLMQFREKLDKNRKLAEKKISSAEFDLLEFDRLSQQGTNDASSITRRFEILKSYLNL